MKASTYGIMLDTNKQAPTKKIENSSLSNYQLSLLQKFDQKLVQTLGPKQNYTALYHAETVMNLGLKVTKVHCVLRFTQSKWSPTSL